MRASRSMAPRLAVLTMCAALAAPSVAVAQGSRSLFGVDVQAGAELLVDAANEPLHGVGAGGAIDFELNALPVLGVHGGVVVSGFASGPQGAIYVGGRLGLRFHYGALIEEMLHDGWIEAHGTFGASDGIARPGFDVGLGFAFHLAQDVRLGPFARFNFAHDQLGNHPMWITAGLELQLWGDPRNDARDTDGDGVVDPQDLCPLEPAGALPDPARRGCPARDGDADGVIDADDLCPQVPAGPQPDPSRSGCPLECAAGTVMTDAGCSALDADGDGVADPDDLCPTSAAGEHPDPDRPGCPDGDDDADGVRNHADRCPTQAQGLHPDPERPGCPLPDRDDDSIIDRDDACPDQAGAPSRDLRRHGCPGDVIVRGGAIQISRPVFFATRRDRILPRSRAVLRAVAEAMLASPGIELLSIEGHTDDVGDEAFNLELSQRRAANVMAFLIQEGVAPNRLEAHGFGEGRPLIPTLTEDARSVNRRVEFRILRAHGEVIGQLPVAVTGP